jgi:hypothetical protein
MRTNKFFFLVGFVLTAILFAEIATHADEADQATKITFSKPVEIPGQVLAPGTYLFELVDFNEQNLVEVFNADKTHLYATVQTNPTERLEPTGNTAITLAEEPGRPDALLKWFYPGNTSGHEFVYSKHEEQQLAQDRQHTIVGTSSAESGD